MDGKTDKPKGKRGKRCKRLERELSALAARVSDLEQHRPWWTIPNVTITTESTRNVPLNITPPVTWPTATWEPYHLTRRTTTL